MCTKSQMDGQNHKIWALDGQFFTNACLDGHACLKTGDLGTLLWFKKQEHKKPSHFQNRPDVCFQMVYAGYILNIFALE